MRTMKKTLSAAVLAVAFAGGAYGFLGSPLIPLACAHLKDYPKLADADEALKDASEYLEKAPHDFKGHRKEALHAIHEARDQISLAVGSVSKAPQPQSAFTPLDEEPHAKKPRLHAAHQRLMAAEKFLKESSEEFNGHKKAAMKAIKEAARQVKICMDNDLDNDAK